MWMGILTSLKESALSLFKKKKKKSAIVVSVSVVPLDMAGRSIRVVFCILVCLCVFVANAISLLRPHGQRRPHPEAIILHV